MKLTNYVMDLGRAVAYYPGLKRIIPSTNAIIFICQLLYWRDKTKNEGWVYKSSDEIEEETGLTYNEQRTARRQLLELNLTFEAYKRLDHRIQFKINEEELNRLWEAVTGKKSEKKGKPQKEVVVEPTPAPKPVEEPKEESKYAGKEYDVTDENGKVVRTRTTAIKPEGDLVDALLKFSQSPGAKKMHTIIGYKTLMETSFRINTDNSKWEKFYEFAFIREDKHNEKFEDFVKWMKDSPKFDIVFWSPEKMKTMYPQAFIDIRKSGYRDDFCPVAPLPKEKVYDAVPEEYKLKKDLY